MKPEPAPMEIGDVILGASLAPLWPRIMQAATSKLPLLLLGPTGSGKTVLAELIARLSGLPGPFVTLDCAAMGDSLLESELFGYVKGAHSTATADKPGLFELARGGTAFTDEIGDASLTMQGRFLRFMAKGLYHALGDPVERHSDARVILATNRDLPPLVAAGKFREDLFYRIQGLTLTLPALRDRRADIPGLVAHFARKAALPGSNPIAVDPSGMRAMQKYRWPGNVRELENFIKRIAESHPDGGVISPCTIKELLPKNPRRWIVRKTVVAALKFTGYNMTATAEILGVDRSTLYRLRVKFELIGGDWPDDGSDSP